MRYSIGGEQNKLRRLKSILSLSHTLKHFTAKRNTITNIVYLWNTTHSPSAAHCLHRTLVPLVRIGPVFVELSPSAPEVTHREHLGSATAIDRFFDGRALDPVLHFFRKKQAHDA